MAHTTHPAPIRPDTRGDLSWRSLAEQLGFTSVSDLVAFLDLGRVASSIDERETVPLDVEDYARQVADMGGIPDSDES